MISNDDKRDRELPTSISHTRRRFLQLTGLGSVGLAGCTRVSPEQLDTVTNAPSTLIATWRGHDPTRTVTLQWISPTSDPSESVVGVSAENGDSETMERTDVDLFGDSDHYEGTTLTDIRPFGDTSFEDVRFYRHPLYRHRAVLTDLEPDTRYSITIDESDTGLAVRTAPEELLAPLTFAEGGDIDTLPTVPRMHGQAAEWDPLFGLVGGDLAYADARHPDQWITFLEHWSEYMRSGNRLIPLVAAIGDHESERELHGTPDEAPFFYALFDNPHREHAYWALDIGDFLSILILDSNHSTAVGGAQTEWFEEALAKRTDREHLMAAYHIPAYPSAKPIGEGGRDDIRQHWVPLLQEYDVDVAFEHDDHAYKRTHLLRNGEPDPDDGILYIGDGAWGRGPRDVKSPDERPYLAVSESALHAFRIELLPDGTRQFRAVDPDGTTIDRFNGMGTSLRSNSLSKAVSENPRDHGV